jgi:hypothetical protein
MFLVGNEACTLPGELLHGKEMVGKVTATTATIQLVAGDACAPSTRFRLLYDTEPREGPEDYAYQSPERSGFSEHDPIVFDLGSLSPNTRYYYLVGYDVGLGWTYRDAYSFHTQRPAGAGFRFCLVADTHVYPHPLPIGDVHLAYQNVLADGPDILITLGDDYYGANEGPAFVYPWREPETLWATWTRTRGILDAAGHSMFYLPVNGNHEGLFGWTTHTDIYRHIREGKMQYLPVPDNRTFPEGGDHDGRYGAFTWGDVLFVWLDIVGFCPVDRTKEPANSFYVLGDEQKRFLQTTLKNSSATWKFVLAHHLFGGGDDWWPGYGRGNANDAFQYEQTEIQAMMEQYGAQAFFYGHDHLFSTSKANDVSYICCGHPGSGCPWSEEASEYYAPYEVLVTDAHDKVPAGHVRVDVSSSETAVSYIRASDGADNGSVISSYTMHP